VKGVRKKEDPYNASTYHPAYMEVLGFKICQSHVLPSSPEDRMLTFQSVIAGFFTGGALAIRGGARAARNSAIGCACLLAVIEGVGIGFQRMMAENTRLDVCHPQRGETYLFPLLTSCFRCHYPRKPRHQKVANPSHNLCSNKSRVCHPTP
jgi:hypothetical protein